MPKAHPSKWLVLVTVSLGLFMALLDATIVNIAVPAIMTEMKAGVSEVSWVLNAYNLGLLVLILAVGRLSDRLGQKRVFLAGLVLFTGFSLACGLAPSIGWLVAFRVGQSVGAAALIPVSLSILLGAFPRRQHGLATGVWGGIGAVAAALGPTIGGALTEYASWNWIFFVNVPIGVVAVALLLAFVPEHRRATSGGLDPLGIFLSAAGFFSLTLALIQGNDWGWSSPSIMTLLAGAAVLLVAWVVWELRTASPLFDLRLFRDRVFAGASGGMLIMGLAMMGSMFLLVIYMVNVLGYSELEAAVAVTPMPALGALLAPVVGKLLDHISPRVPAAVGMLAMAAGLLLLRQLQPDATLWDVSWRTLLLGAGLGLAMPSLAIAGMSAVPHHAGGAGSGVINWARQMGFVLGVALLVAVFSQSMTDSMQDAVRQAGTVVDRQTSIPAPARAAMLSSIEKNVAATVATPGRTAADLDPLAGALPDTPGASGAAGTTGASGAAGGAGSSSANAELQTRLKAELTSIFATARSDAFDLPILVAACVALLGVVPALLLGPRRAARREGGEDEVPGPLAGVV